MKEESLESDLEKKKHEEEMIVSLCTTDCLDFFKYVPTKEVYDRAKYAIKKHKEYVEKKELSEESLKKISDAIMQLEIWIAYHKSSFER